MLGSIASTKRLIPPLHFDKVKIAIKLYRSVNLLDYTDTRYLHGESFANKYFERRKKTIQNTFQGFAAALRVIFSEKGE